jgi:hypothetical protein
MIRAVAAALLTLPPHPQINLYLQYFLFYNSMISVRSSCPAHLAPYFPILSNLFVALVFSPVVCEVIFDNPLGLEKGSNFG